MNARVALLGLSMVAVALAGCSGGGDEGPSAAEKCEMDDMFWNDGVCEAHVEPSIILSGLEEPIAAYSTYTFNYRLDNGTRGMDGTVVHSMDSRVMASTETSLPTNTTLPDDYGTEIARVEHQNLPGEFEGEFTWPTAGETVTLWGYMRIDGVHMWNQLGQFSISDVVASGTTHTIVLHADPGPTTDKPEQQATIGDAFVFQNDFPAPTVASYTISFSCTNGVSYSAITVDAGASSSSMMLTEPTSCTWTANSQASATGNDPFAISGKINAFAP